MKIIPAIDILAGQCVRLTKGDFATKKIYSADVLAMAKKFQDQGASMLHIVDLGAAKTGRPASRELIIKIAKTVNIPIQVGGGIRSLKTATAYLDSGIERIVIGTKAFYDNVFLASLIRKYGSDRIVVAVEVKQGKIVVNGWQKKSNKNYMDFAKELKVLGVSEILFTDVNKDGTLSGPNLQAIQKLIGLGLNVTASGGIAKLASIDKLKKLGASAVILGKALYENQFSLRGALNAAKPKSSLTKRIIPCLDVKDGKVVKGVRFKGHAVVGDIVELARRYSKQGADELVFYDITASTQGRVVSADWVRAVARVINIPFCVAGGIKTASDARKILQNGADKISINSPALANPGLIKKLAREFGSQCVVVGIDSFEKNGEYFVKQYTGDASKTKLTIWRTADWAKEVQKLGAGEIVLNCMNRDGVRRGYDVKQLKLISAGLSIPVIASGGAGSKKDFREILKEAGASGALAASVFHSNLFRIASLKKYLLTNNIPVRV